ncbi:MULTISPECIES: DUF3325 domain-containing protein [Sphingomonas]|uniref:DUF3325 domain-containing protein n=1 Tax=Sphingomonas TaxID=13687 RepID=UPI0020C03473|nr:DUF3325 domain-containing protein [Sphingomonas faeni]MCK8455542.1 DUF3325 domain-containing protein [Sphingomonas faeni]
MLTTIAFLLLGLATDAHHRRWFDASVGFARRRMLRINGWAILVVSAAPAILIRGWIFGPILWTAALMTGAGLAFMVLNFVPVGKNMRKVDRRST